MTCNDKELLLCLPHGAHSGIIIAPSKFSKGVFLSNEAWICIQRAQNQLPSDLTLVLIRGYTGRSFVRTILRKIGSLLFFVIYPARRHEIADIFGANGHDQDGNHLDVGIAIRGRKLNFLPLHVFTPRSIQLRRRAQHLDKLLVVCHALRSEGFDLHRNATESLQIHVDLRRAATESYGG